MSKFEDLTRDRRIKNHIRKLRDLYRGLSQDRRRMAEALAERIAFMRVILEDLEQDIASHGATEEFSQTPAIVYVRERPAVRIYNQVVKNFAAVSKQFVDLLPPYAKDQTDELMEFVKRRAR